MNVVDVLLPLVPLAAVIAINPLPVIAMILVLQTTHGRRAGAAFAGAWVVGLLALGGAAIVIANQTDLHGSGTASPLARAIRGLLGLFLIALAVRKWLGRPRRGEKPKTPKWMDVVASTTPARSARLGALLAAGNPKNIAVTLAAAAGIVESGLSWGSEAVALVFFVVVSTLGIAVPLVAYVIMGDQGDELLARWGRWLERHNVVVMAIVLLAVGVLLVLGAVSG